MKNAFSLQRLLCLIGLTLSLSEVTLAETQTWKNECVGRFQISVPREVEVFLPAPRAFDAQSNELMARFLLNSKTFSDNGNKFKNLNKTSYSQFIYQGDIGITTEVPEIDFENLRKMYKGRKQFYLENAPLLEKQGFSAAADDYREKAANFQPMDYDKKNMFGWDEKASSFIYLYQDNRIFIFDLNLSADKILQVFRPRPLYTLPKGEGVCIP